MSNGKMDMNALMKQAQKLQADVARVQEELQKVTWPDRQTVIRLTVIVIVISAIVAAYILGADQLFTYLVNNVLLHQGLPTPVPSTP